MVFILYYSSINTHLVCSLMIVITLWLSHFPYWYQPSCWFTFLFHSLSASTIGHILFLYLKDKCSNMSLVIINTVIYILIIYLVTTSSLVTLSNGFSLHLILGLIFLFLLFWFATVLKDHTFQSFITTLVLAYVVP